MAREFSEDKARQGGSLGWKARGSLDPAFEEVAFGLEASSTGSPKLGEAKTGFGYHIIMVSLLYASGAVGRMAVPSGGAGLFQYFSELDTADEDRLREGNKTIRSRTDCCEYKLLVTVRPVMKLAEGTYDGHHARAAIITAFNEYFRSLFNSFFVCLPCEMTLTRPPSMRDA